MLFWQAASKEYFVNNLIFSFVLAYDIYLRPWKHCPIHLCWWHHSGQCCVSSRPGKQFKNVIFRLYDTYLSYSYTVDALNTPPVSVAKTSTTYPAKRGADTRGADNTDNKVSKLSVPAIEETLTYMSSLCIDKSYSPTHLKQLIPDDPGYPIDRSISVLSSLSQSVKKHFH